MSATPVSMRLVSPLDARRAGGYPSERNFDFSALAHLRPRLVEVEALCLDTGTKADRGFAELGERMARYLIAEGLDFIFTAAAVGIGDGGHGAASLHARAMACASSPEDLRVVPRVGLRIEHASTASRTQDSTHLERWIQLGAWACGDPAWSRERHCAEVPLLLPLARMRSRHARRFIAQAA